MCSINLLTMGTAFPRVLHRNDHWLGTGIIIITLLELLPGNGTPVRPIVWVHCGTGARRSGWSATRVPSAVRGRWSRTAEVTAVTWRPTTSTTDGLHDCATVSPAASTTSARASVLRSTPVASADERGTSSQRLVSPTLTTSTTFKRRNHRRHHPCKILCQLVKGFFRGSTPKSAIFYTFSNDPYNSSALPCRLCKVIYSTWIDPPIGRYGSCVCGR